METHARNQDLGSPLLSGLYEPWVGQPFPILSSLPSQASSGSQDGSKLTVWEKGLSNFNPHHLISNPPLGKR